MKFWISKYALTQGIYEVEAEKTTNHLGEVETMIMHKVDGMLVMYHGKEWHVTKEEAMRKAEEMRLKKIESLKKSIIKLEKLKF